MVGAGVEGGCGKELWRRNNFKEQGKGWFKKKEKFIR